MEETISVTNVEKRFGDVVALDRLTLSFGKGIFGLVGPNGAGKTTLLRIILGLIRADAGQVRVLGFDASNESLTIRRRVGVLHERPLFSTSLTVLHYLQRVSQLFGASRPLEELLQLVGLGDARQRRIKGLSAGMRQRLGIAQALVGCPDLVFLDEPTSNLDVMGRKDLLDTILRVHESDGTSFCIISHVLSELERVCSDIAFIRAGRTLVAGPLRDVIGKYAANQYNIAVSNPRLICGDIGRIDGVISAEVAGIGTITIVVKKTDITPLRIEVERLAALRGVTVHSIERASSLEQAFMEAMRNE